MNDNEMDAGNKTAIPTRAQESAKVTEPKSGYELAARILAEHRDRGDAIEAMLEASGGQESDWLEFKAGMTLLPEHEKQAKTQKELYLKYALAVAAMLNTRGGAFVIGVDDKNHKPVPLSTCDPRHVLESEGWDGYLRREVLDRIDPSDCTIDCTIKGKGHQWHFSASMAPYIETCSIPFQGEKIIGLLVQPCPPGGEITVDWGPNEFVEFLPIRKRGEVGCVKRLNGHGEISSYLEWRRNGGRGWPVGAAEWPSGGYSTVESPCEGRFLGREAELEQLHQLLENGKMPIIAGAAGTGKSELVRQYAFRHREYYPGGMFQIDMERVTNWPEAFLRLLDRPSNQGVRVAECLEIGKSNENRQPSEKKRLTGEEVRDALIRRAGQHGPILLVLDNIESCETLFGDGEGEARMFPAGLAGGVKINVVATARVFDASPGVAVPFPLGDLSPEASLELLLTQHPAETEEERKAAERVADLLGHRALFLRRVPAILDAKLSRNSKMVCRSYAALAKALKKDILAAIGRTGKVDDAHLPGTLWAMTRDSLAGSSIGDAAVRLVRLAAHFPAEGFPQHILRRLWATEVFPGIADEGLTVDEAFGFVLDSCQDRNLFQSTDPVRIHRLDREAVLRDPGTEESELSQAIARSLSGCPGATPGVWLSLADFPDIIRRMPATMANGRFHARLLAKNPALADYCPWERLQADLNGEDWLALLLEAPQFADKCPWEKLSTEDCCDVLAEHDWADLLAVHPQFADKCPWGKLDFMEWEKLIKRCPQFADKLPWEKLDGGEWARVLSGHPQFAEQYNCPWDKLGTGDWVGLLCRQPRFGGQCPWAEFAGDEWARVLAEQPLFAELYNCPWDKLGTADWVELLCRQPRFGGQCPWEEFNGSNWARVLSVQPQFAELYHCPWDKLDTDDWVGLLCRQPRFGGQCPWEMFESKDWVQVLSAQPLLAEVHKCPWKNFSGKEWTGLLKRQPRFGDHCQWDKLSLEDWFGNRAGWNSGLIHDCPQFTARCPLEALDGRHWVELLIEQPRWGEECPWEKLDGLDWVELLHRRPQFADKCPWKKLDAGRDTPLLLSGFRIIVLERDRKGWLWSRLLQKQPQFADRCPWQTFSGGNWAELLGLQPQFAEICAWDTLDGRDWAELLARQPQFAEECAWEKLDGGNWAYLLRYQPQFADRCPWKKMTGRDFHDLLFAQPQLEACRPEHFAPDPWLEEDGDLFEDNGDTVPQDS